MIEEIHKVIDRKVSIKNHYKNFNEKNVLLITLYRKPIINKETTKLGVFKTYSTKSGNSLLSGNFVKKKSGVTY